MAHKTQHVRAKNKTQGTMSTGNRRKQKFPRRAAWTTVAVLSSCLGVAWGAPVGPTTSPTASTFSAILLAPCPAPGTSTPGGTGGGNGACPPESCCIRNSAMAEAQASLAQCQPTASPQPCKTFHGLCSQTGVAHYSMVTSPSDWTTSSNSYRHPLLRVHVAPRLRRKNWLTK